VGGRLWLTVQTFDMRKAENASETEGERNRYLNDQFVDFGFDWEIHPAYRWALQPTSFADIFQVTDLDSDSREAIVVLAQDQLPKPTADALKPTSTKRSSASGAKVGLVKKADVGLVKRR
jgi:hypothetical protein